MHKTRKLLVEGAAGPRSVQPRQLKGCLAKLVCQTVIWRSPTPSGLWQQSSCFAEHRLSTASAAVLEKARGPWGPNARPIHRCAGVTRERPDVKQGRAHAAHTGGRRLGGCKMMLCMLASLEMSGGERGGLVQPGAAGWKVAHIHLPTPSEATGNLFEEAAHVSAESPMLQGGKRKE